MNSVSLKLDFFCPIEFLLTNALFELFPKSPYILNVSYNQNLIGQFFDILGKVQLEREIYLRGSLIETLCKNNFYYLKFPPIFLTAGKIIFF